MTPVCLLYDFEMDIRAPPIYSHFDYNIAIYRSPLNHLLCVRSEKWYDGYQLSELLIYNPKSVVDVLTWEDFQSYWSDTEEG